MNRTEAATVLLEQRKAKGFPPKIADPAVLRRLAGLFGVSQEVVRDTPVRKAS